MKQRLGLDLLESLGALMQDRPAELLEETQQDGYLCRKYVLETLPEVFMPFYMLLPDDGVSGSARAILAIPAHGANKNTVCGIAETEEEAERNSEFVTLIELFEEERKVANAAYDERTCTVKVSLRDGTVQETCFPTGGEGTVAFREYDANGEKTESVCIGEK